MLVLSRTIALQASTNGGETAWDCFSPIAGEVGFVNVLGLDLHRYHCVSIEKKLCFSKCLAGLALTSTSCSPLWRISDFNAPKVKSISQIQY